MIIDIATLDSLDSPILVQSGAHICIGSRYLPNSNLERSRKDTIVSCLSQDSYKGILRATG